MSRPDKDPALTNIMAAAQSALQALLPKGVACVLIIGRGSSLRVAKNVSDKGARDMMAEASAAALDESDAIDLEKLRQ